MEYEFDGRKFSSRNAMIGFLKRRYFAQKARIETLEITVERLRREIEDLKARLVAVAEII